MRDPRRDGLAEQLRRLALTGCQSDEQELIDALLYAADDLDIVRGIVNRYYESLESLNLMAERIASREYREDRVTEEDDV
jgi:hypothetical protein